MIKRLLQKWRQWEDAFLGADDLQGEEISNLERRIRHLEEDMDVLHRQGNQARPGDTTIYRS